MKYLVTENVPGYLPTDDDGALFDTIREAWEYAREELYLRACENTGEEPDSGVVNAMASHYNNEQIGTVYAPTPGYEGSHDLGVAFTVSEHFEQDEEQPMGKRKFEQPIVVVSDGGPITITESSHEEMIRRIREWMFQVQIHDDVAPVERKHDLYAMGEAAITLLEVDASTGISLEDFGPVGDMVSRVVAYAFGHNPRYTTVHWTVA